MHPVVFLYLVSWSHFYASASILIQTIPGQQSQVERALSEPSYVSGLPIRSFKKSGVKASTRTDPTCTDSGCLGTVKLSTPFKFQMGSLVTAIAEPPGAHLQGSTISVQIPRLDTEFNLGFQYTHPAADYCHIFATSDDENFQHLDSGDEKWFLENCYDSSNVRVEPLDDVSEGPQSVYWDTFTKMGAEVYKCGHWTVHDLVTFKQGLSAKVRANEGMASYRINSEPFLKGEICVTTTQTTCLPIEGTAQGGIVVEQKEGIKVTLKGIAPPKRVHEGFFVYKYQIAHDGIVEVLDSRFSSASAKESPAVIGHLGEFKSACFLKKGEQSCGMSVANLRSLFRQDLHKAEDDDSYAPPDSRSLQRLSRMSKPNPTLFFDNDMMLYRSMGSPDTRFVGLLIGLFFGACLLAGAGIATAYFVIDGKECVVTRPRLNYTQAIEKIFKNQERLEVKFAAQGLVALPSLATISGSGTGASMTGRMRSYESQDITLEVEASGMHLEFVQGVGVINSFRLLNCEIYLYSSGTSCVIAVDFSGASSNIPIYGKGDTTLLTNWIPGIIGIGSVEVALRSPQFKYTPEICIRVSAVESTDDPCAVAENVNYIEQETPDLPTIGDGDSNPSGGWEGTFSNLFFSNVGFSAMMIILMIVGAIGFILAIYIMCKICSNKKYMAQVIMMSPKASAHEDDSHRTEEQGPDTNTSNTGENRNKTIRGFEQDTPDIPIIGEGDGNPSGSSDGSFHDFLWYSSGFALLIIAMCVSILLVSLAVITLACIVTLNKRRIVALAVSALPRVPGEKIGGSEEMRPFARRQAARHRSVRQSRDGIATCCMTIESDVWPVEDSKRITCTAITGWTQDGQKCYDCWTDDCGVIPYKSFYPDLVCCLKVATAPPIVTPAPLKTPPTVIPENKTTSTYGPTEEPVILSSWPIDPEGECDGTEELSALIILILALATGCYAFAFLMMVPQVRGMVCSSEINTNDKSSDPYVLVAGSSLPVTILGHVGFIRSVTLGGVEGLVTKVLYLLSSAIILMGSVLIVWLKISSTESDPGLETAGAILALGLLLFLAACASEAASTRIRKRKSRRARARSNIYKRSYGASMISPGSPCVQPVEQEECESLNPIYQNVVETFDHVADGEATDENFMRSESYRSYKSYEGPKTVVQPPQQPAILTTLYLILILLTTSHATCIGTGTVTPAGLVSVCYDNAAALAAVTMRGDISMIGAIRNVQMSYTMEVCAPSKLEEASKGSLRLAPEDLCHDKFKKQSCFWDKAQCKEEGPKLLISRYPTVSTKTKSCWNRTMVGRSYTQELVSGIKNCNHELIPQDRAYRNLGREYSMTSFSNVPSTTASITPGLLVALDCGTMNVTFRRYEEILMDTAATQLVSKICGGPGSKYLGNDNVMPYDPIAHDYPSMIYVESSTVKPEFHYDGPMYSGGEIPDHTSPMVCQWDNGEYERRIMTERGINVWAETMGVVGIDRDHICMSGTFVGGESFRCGLNMHSPDVTIQQPAETIEEFAFAYSTQSFFFVKDEVIEKKSTGERTIVRGAIVGVNTSVVYNVGQTVWMGRNHTPRTITNPINRAVCRIGNFSVAIASEFSDAEPRVQHVTRPLYEPNFAAMLIILGTAPASGTAFDFMTVKVMITGANSLNFQHGSLIFRYVEDQILRKFAMSDGMTIIVPNQVFSWDIKTTIMTDVVLSCPTECFVQDRHSGKTVIIVALGITGYTSPYTPVEVPGTKRTQAMQPRSSQCFDSENIVTIEGQLVKARFGTGSLMLNCTTVDVQKEQGTSVYKIFLNCQGNKGKLIAYGTFCTSDIRHSCLMRNEQVSAFTLTQNVRLGNCSMNVALVTPTGVPCDTDIAMVDNKAIVPTGCVVTQGSDGYIKYYSAGEVIKPTAGAGTGEFLMSHRLARTAIAYPQSASTGSCSGFVETSKCIHTEYPWQMFGMWFFFAFVILLLSVVIGVTCHQKKQLSKLQANKQLPDKRLMEIEAKGKFLQHVSGQDIKVLRHLDSDVIPDGVVLDEGYGSFIDTEGDFLPDGSRNVQSSKASKAYNYMKSKVSSYKAKFDDMVSLKPKVN